MKDKCKAEERRNAYIREVDEIRVGLITHYDTTVNNIMTAGDETAFFNDAIFSHTILRLGVRKLSKELDISATTYEFKRLSYPKVKGGK